MIETKKPYICNLIFFGDSYVAGTLKDENDIPNSIEEQHRVSFSTHVANSLKVDEIKHPITFCENKAKAGNSNEGIFYDIINHLDYAEGNYIEPKTTFVFVAWSSLIRFGKYDERLKSVETYKKEERDFHYIDVCIKSYSVIVAAYQILKSRGYNFLFSSSFTDFSQHSIFNKYLSQDIIDSWWNYGKNDNNLYDMITHNKFHFTKRLAFNEHKHYDNNHPNVSKCYHPNKKGHKLIAKKLSEYINSNYRLKLRE